MYLKMEYGGHRLPARSSDPGGCEFKSSPCFLKYNFLKYNYISSAAASISIPGLVTFWTSVPCRVAECLWQLKFGRRTSATSSSSQYYCLRDAVPLCPINSVIQLLCLRMYCSKSFCLVSLACIYLYTFRFPLVQPRLSSQLAYILPKGVIFFLHGEILPYSR